MYVSRLERQDCRITFDYQLLKLAISSSWAMSGGSTTIYLVQPGSGTIAASYTDLVLDADAKNRRRLLCGLPKANAYFELLGCWTG